MQGSKKNPVIEKHPSAYCKCTKCGTKLVWWHTKYGKMVYGCETCGWAEVEDE